MNTHNFLGTLYPRYEDEDILFLCGGNPQFSIFANDIIYSLYIDGLI